MSGARWDQRISPNTITDNVHDAAVNGLRLASEHILTESRAITPVDTARLQQSGAATVDETSLRAAVSYDTPYAAIVHEDLQARHLPPGQAKFLEDAAAEAAETVEALIAAAIAQALE
ncbi:hypothetical protein ACIBKY_50930 [Nonomuraea sp. NPDC050394]|uniref:hypothetical protein n=1 Tax=Nonomuraea sp. NPDC050394 TaxID=3364363 RepID=UPI0037B61ED3